MAAPRLNLSRHQLHELGLGHLLPPPPHARPGAPPDGMNGTERRFRDDVLEPLVRSNHLERFAFEALKFRLAGRTFYTPDFLAVSGRGRYPSLIDVKGGYIREDAAIKIKVAAALYPEFRWFLATRSDRRWRLYQVTDRGISANDVPISRIHGGH